MEDRIYREWLAGVLPEEREELLAIGKNPQELKERFALELAFGTAGMRGEVGMGTYRMNRYTVMRATRGLANYVRSLGEAGCRRGVVISYDTRRFSRVFAITVAEVLSAYGVNAFLFEDVRPVPMCSFAVRYFGAAAGVMITASHNPKEYNGYKVYGEDGAQMAPEPTAEVVRFIRDNPGYFDVKTTPIADDFRGKDNVKLNDYVTVIGKTVDEAYYDAILKLSLSPELTAERGKDIKLVYTPVHGAGYIPVTTTFAKLGIRPEIVKEQAMPDTEFSTVKVPNPEQAETLSMGIALGKQTGADVVLGTDPDCDRLGVAVRDDKGEFVLLSGNQIGVLMLDYILTRLKERGELPQNGAIVKTIVTTTLADRLAKSYGLTVFNVLTGFKYIGEKIKEWEASGEYTYLFGYEESYGTLRGTHARDKDAVVGSMLFAELCLYWESRGKTVYQRLDELFRQFGYYAERNTSIVYKGLDGMQEMANVMKALRARKVEAIGDQPVCTVKDYLTRTAVSQDGTVEPIDLPQSDVVYFELADGQFVCVRPSGTEPKLKIYVLVYAADKAAADRKADRTMAAIKEILA